jgi:methyl-accepting chemotaxis protein
MKPDIKRLKFFSLYFVLFALFVANSWMLYVTFSNVTEHEAWVVHTEDVINELDHVRSAVVDMETGQRGFLLLHDRSFLEPYRLGSINLTTRLKSLRELLSDDPKQITQYDILKDLIETRVEHLNYILEIVYMISISLK